MNENEEYEKYRKQCLETWGVTPASFGKWRRILNQIPDFEEDYTNDIDGE